MLVLTSTLCAHEVQIFLQNTSREQKLLVSENILKEKTIAGSHNNRNVDKPNRK